MQLLWVSAFVLLFQVISAGLLKQVYSDQDGVVPCQRYLNSTSVIGCQASGSYGVLYPVSTPAELDDFFAATSKGQLRHSYIIVLDSNMLTVDYLDRTVSYSFVQGTIVLFNNVSTPSYSDESTLDGRNPAGRDLMLQRYDKAIFAIPLYNPALVTYIRWISQYNKDQRFLDYPLYGAELQAFMWGAQNSEACLRKTETQPRPFCSVLGSWSIVSSLSSATTIQQTPEKEILVVSAQLDTRSVFGSMSVGALSYLSGVFALLAAEEVLGKTDIRQGSKHVLFALFNAESWDLSGSRRFVQDIVSFKCEKTSDTKDSECVNPLRMTMDFQSFRVQNFKSIIHVGQVANDDLYQYGNLDLGIRAAPTTNMPVSSVTSFTEHISTAKYAVLTDSPSAGVNNPYYFAPFDQLLNSTQLDTTCRASSALANVIYKNVMGSVPSTPLMANCALIKDLHECFATNFTCSLAKTFLNSSMGRSSRDVGFLYAAGKFTRDISLLKELMSNYSATNVSSQTCRFDNDCPGRDVCNINKCITSFTRFHPAYGTALDYDSSRNRYVVRNKSDTRPSWTISLYSTYGMRLYLSDSPSSEAGQVFGGLMFTFIGIMGTLRVGRHFNSLVHPQ